MSTAARPSPPFDEIVGLPHRRVVAIAGLSLAGPKRATDRNAHMSRTSFTSPATTIVVSTDGYFDVYPPTGRANGDKPKYRGRLAELGAGIRGLDDRLGVRPDSAALAAAVTVWSAVHGSAALTGSMGGGRDGTKESL